MRDNPFMYFSASSFVFFVSVAALTATGCTDKPIPGGTSGTGGFGGGAGTAGSGGSAGSGGEGGGGVPFAGGLLVVGSTINSNTALYRFSLDGTWSKKIAKVWGSVYLSANRSRIAAWRTQDGLIFFDPDGNDVATLELPNVVTWSLGLPRISISPSGHYIAYFMDAIEPERSIYVAPTDGTGGELLFTGTSGFWEWSPVDDKLALGGAGVPLRIYDPDTKTMVNAMNSLGTKETRELAWWSPDGQRLAFVEKLPNELVLASVDKQGQDRRLLLTNLSNSVIGKYGQWSPDGQYFALTQYVGGGLDLQVRLVDANGTMSRDIMDDIDSYSLGPSSWSPTNHFVYVKKDDSIKSVTLSGTTLELMGPGYEGSKRLGRNGRVMYCGDMLGCGTIGADGSNPITYSPASVHTSKAQMSPDGTMIVFTPDPDAAKNLPIYAASSESAETTLVSLLTNQLYSPFLDPIHGGSGIVFDGVNIAGWILPTANGLKAIYPQPVFGHIAWASSLE